MSRRLTNLASPDHCKKIKDHTTAIGGMIAYLKYIIFIQEDIYAGIYEELCEEEYIDDSNHYLSLIELVNSKGLETYA